MSAPLSWSFVGAQLVGQADYPPFLMQVQEHAAPFGRSLRTRRRAGAAIAAQRVQRVAGEALGVDAHENVFAVAHVAHDQRDVGDVVDSGFVRDATELTELGRQIELRDAVDELSCASGRR